MQYSMFDELAVSHRLASLERTDRLRVAEAEALYPRAGMRESIAGALVRLGITLDHAAGERAISSAAGRPTQ